MLVLTRKKGEAVILNDNIEITVLGIDGDQIKLGINAPKNVDIYRKEVYLSIQEENKQAANQNVSMDIFRSILKKNEEK